MTIFERKSKLESQVKFNRGRICRRAYWLIHNADLSQSDAMKQAWKEAKSFIVKLRFELNGVICQIADMYTPMKSNKMINESHNKLMEIITA